MSISELKNCPQCNASWDAGDIYETFLLMKQNGDAFWSKKSDEEIEQLASHYGWSRAEPKHFSRIVGLEYPHKYDGVWEWMCPDCKHKFPRFAEK